MFRLKRTLGVCMLAVALMPTLASHAATYYVATEGSNSNPGTEEHPWRTIAFAVNQMQAGDTTYVDEGTYVETGVRFARTGTQGAPIKLLNAPGKRPIIQCSSTSIIGVLFQHSSGISGVLGWITVAGFEITNCFDGVKFYNLHDALISRNWIHHNINQGILGNGSARVAIDRNTINHNGPWATAIDSNQKHGIYASGVQMRITNNLIYDQLAFGIQQNGSSSSTSTYIAPAHRGSSGWIVANNVIAYNRNRGAIVVWGSNTQNTRIENNIFYQNNYTNSGTQGIGFASPGSTSGILIRNNISYAGTSSSTTFIGGGTEGVNYTQSGNAVNATNPGFVNAPSSLPGSPNFALTERSPAIDKGLSLAVTNIAFDGTPRPQGRAFDIGAYEYSFDGDSRPPAPVLNVQVH